MKACKAIVLGVGEMVIGVEVVVPVLPLLDGVPMLVPQALAVQYIPPKRGRREAHRQHHHLSGKHQELLWHSTAIQRGVKGSDTGHIARGVVQLVSVLVDHRQVSHSVLVVEDDIEVERGGGEEGADSWSRLYQEAFQDPQPERKFRVVVSAEKQDH